MLQGFVCGRKTEFLRHSLFCSFLHKGDLVYHMAIFPSFSFPNNLLEVAKAGP
jgi:hypothetical protein